MGAGDSARCVGNPRHARVLTGFEHHECRKTPAPEEMTLVTLETDEQTSIRKDYAACSSKIDVCLHVLCISGKNCAAHHSRPRITIAATFQYRSAMMRSSLFLIAAMLAVCSCKPAASRELQGAVSSPAHCHCRSLILRPSRFTCRLYWSAHLAGVARHVRGLHMHNRQGLHRLALDPAAWPCTIAASATCCMGQLPQQQLQGAIGSCCCYCRQWLRRSCSNWVVPICANPCMSTHPSPPCHLEDVGRCGAGGEATQTHAVDTSRALAIWLMPSSCSRRQDCSESCSVRRRRTPHDHELAEI